jgi:gamma-glutamyltranspeptidase/glutathione hydrolase
MSRFHGLSRRRFVATAAAGAVIGAVTQGNCQVSQGGVVIGQSEGAEAGNQVLKQGGNAVDAVVAAALVSGVVSIHNCGIGGYGGHMVVARPDGRVTAIDFNSAAPAAARADMFPLDERGVVRGGIDRYGWLAAGVPGTLAGLQKGLDEFGTRTFSDLAVPAIRHAREGFKVPASLARLIKAHQARLAADPGIAKLLFSGGKPLGAGATLRNPELATLLETLAEEGSVLSFYRGKIAEQIAAAFKQHGGLVTAEDLAAYEAPVQKPLSLAWNGATIATAPLTAGGLSVLQGLRALAALHWESSDPADPKTTHMQLEALRLAWQDRLRMLGDPDVAKVPVDRLLSPQQAEAAAARVKQAINARALIPAGSDGRPAGGTIHLSAADSDGMLSALTLTHGEAFGAQVAVAGLGLLLGHGMSRFDPRPQHPNAPGPRKRPLNNMCPTIVVRDGRPVAALGATGGRRIPSTLFAVLCELVGRKRTLPEAATAPRLHTEGDATVRFTAGWPNQVVEHLRSVGYNMQSGAASATLQAVSRDSAGHCTTASG